MSVLYKFKRPSPLEKDWTFSGIRFTEDSRAEVIISNNPPKKSTFSFISAWLLRYELICWEYIGQKAVDMPRVHRLSLKLNLHGSDGSPVERGTKYSWRRRQIRPKRVKQRVVIENSVGFDSLWSLLSLILDGGCYVVR